MQYFEGNYFTTFFSLEKYGDTAGGTRRCLGVAGA